MQAASSSVHIPLEKDDSNGDDDINLSSFCCWYLLVGGVGEPS